MRSPTRVVALAAWVVVCASMAPVAAWAQGSLQPQPPLTDQGRTTDAIGPTGDLRLALIGLPLAAALGTALAMRPRRRGTPPRSSAVIQTQIILAIIGALVMVVVGSSLARAFGVVGVAGLIRYRAKIKDPKDAGVMLSTLAVGLASGVGLYTLAIFATAFFFGALWLLESFEPEARKVIVLTVKSKDATRLEPTIEQLLRRHRAKFALRASSPDAVSFELRLPISQKTDALSKSITELDPESTLEWEEKKNKVPA
jgi:uncharacterized membrane protein YhiD involved in acid resistance